MTAKINDLEMIQFDSPRDSFYSFEVNIEKELYEDIVRVYTRVRYSDVDIALRPEDIHQVFEEELLHVTDGDLEEVGGEPIDSILIGYKCFDSDVNQFMRIKLDCMKTGENSLAIKVDSYEMFSERY